MWIFSCITIYIYSKIISNNDKQNKISLLWSFDIPQVELYEFNAQTIYIDLSNFSHILVEYCANSVTVTIPPAIYLSYKICRKQSYTILTETIPTSIPGGVVYTQNRLIEIYTDRIDVKDAYFLIGDTPTKVENWRNVPTKIYGLNL